MELLINKGEQTIPPSHLRDLSLCDVLETSGKERRHKYFTLPAYRSVMGDADLQTQDQRYANINTSEAGSFLSDALPKGLFYEEAVEMEKHQDDVVESTCVNR